MKLKLTASSGPTFEMNYESMVDYDQPLLDPGSYTAKFMYGDPGDRRADEAYFEGTVTCTIVARKTVTQEVTHTLANSVYTLHLSDWFKNYYTSYSLTVYTESGYQSGHTQVPDLNPTPIFVRANTKLYLSGKATKTNGVGGGISQNADRHHRSPHLAQHRNRRRIGRTGEPRPALRRHAHHGRNPGDRTEPRSITTPNIHRNPKYDSI